MRSILALAAAIYLAACAAGGTVVDYTSYERYGISLFTYAAAERDFLVRITGTPFAYAGGTDFAETVVALMQGANDGPRTRFVSAPTASTRDNFHVALVFNPDGGAGADTACAGQAATTGPGSTPARLLAVFCNRDQPLSFLESRAAAGAPGDPAFRTLIRQSTLHLLPPNDPFADRGECTDSDC